MKITDLKCTVIGRNPVVRIVTDEGISGYAQAENSKSNLKPHVLFYKPFILGADPTHVEPLNVMWLEDMITGDYVPYVLADLYREVTRSTSTSIHTGEQIYLRQNFVELIEKRAVDIIGPDPCDVGGIAELKWVAEYADLHGILIAPHGIGDGLLGLAALVQVSATLPQNLIAFEYPVGRPEWWYEIVEGLPDPIVKESYIEVWDRPGMGVEFNVEAARKYLPEGDEDFFD